MITVLEVTQRSSAKEKELNEEMEFLQEELNHFEQDE